MKFLIQADEVSLVEKRAIRYAGMLENTIHVETRILQRIDMFSPVREMCPVGTVEFVKAWMEMCSVIQPNFTSYPEPLSNKKYLHREIRKGTIEDSEPWEFIKPVYNTKLFTGGLKIDIDPAFLSGKCREKCQVYISEPVEFIAETRYYIDGGILVGSGRYDDNLKEDLSPDMNLVMNAIHDMQASGIAPAGYSLDFGILSNGKTALVEANDGWALGYYKGSIKPMAYASLLWNRWQEIQKAP